MAVDVDKGVVSQDEFRAGLRRVYEHTKGWPNSEVAKASEALLRTFTTGAANADTVAKDQFLTLTKACANWSERR